MSNVRLLCPSEQTILIANRGEVALRIARAARELGCRSIALVTDDDADSAHPLAADRTVRLSGLGPAAFLDQDQILTIARSEGCTLVHPGYGLLSESAAFSAACRAAGLRYIGPATAALEQLGDKARAKALATACAVPTIPGSEGPVDLEAARAFASAEIDAGYAVMLKAVAGGGGKGMRVVRSPHEIKSAYRQCEAEAKAAFGDGGLIVERYLETVRHVEVQILGDGRSVVHLHTRDCSIQRRNQKLVEIAPAPNLPPSLEHDLTSAAIRLGERVGYEGVGTVEFLVDLSGAQLEYYFLEANPRLQVEHTVTEEITGIDIVCTQIELACGATLRSLGLTQETIPRPRGRAIQVRVNAETYTKANGVKPSGGRIEALSWPTGPGIRVDTHMQTCAAPNPHFDSLLLKLIIRTTRPDMASAIDKLRRAMADLTIDGVKTNLPVLDALLSLEGLADWAVSTRLWDLHLTELLDAQASAAGPEGDLREEGGPESGEALLADMFGTVAAVLVEPGEPVRAGQELVLIEAMKMQHALLSPQAAVIGRILVRVGDRVEEGQRLVHLLLDQETRDTAPTGPPIDLDAVPSRLEALRARLSLTEDGARPEALERLRAKGCLTAREKIARLADPGSFREIGQLALAAQRTRLDEEALIRKSPADGLVAGTGTINAEQFERSHCHALIMAYDYSVFAGTQGYFNHQKSDRLIEIAAETRRPIVWFMEGGGGRPGDVDTNPIHATGLTVPTFRAFAGLSGQVPRIGIVSGPCFAGNAALFGCSDLTIATAASSIGMGGPAMIEGGGLGKVRAADVGPASRLARAGVVDILVEGDKDAVDIARKALGYFQGREKEWSLADQRRLRHVVPENRKRAYAVHEVIGTLADEDSVLELRPDFARSMVTALIRIEGRPIALYANNPRFGGGAIDSEGAGKAARLVQLANAFDLPVLTLCDTPGFMVGPEHEMEGAVRKVCRLFLAAAGAQVPFLTVVTRRAFGLGAQAMAGGSFRRPHCVVAWPGAECGAMGIEGGVRLGYAKDLAAEPAGEARDRLFQKLVERHVEAGRAESAAAHVELDAVIDPAETRSWIVRTLELSDLRTRTSRARFVDSW